MAWKFILELAYWEFIVASVQHNLSKEVGKFTLSSQVSLRSLQEIFAMLLHFTGSERYSMKFLGIVYHPRIIMKIGKWINELNKRQNKSNENNRWLIWKIPTIVTVLTALAWWGKSLFQTMHDFKKPHSKFKILLDYICIFIYS